MTLQRTQAIARKKLDADAISSRLVIIPSVIAIIVFVYCFIGYTVAVSMTNWNTLLPDWTFVGLKNYKAVFSSFRFKSDIRNMIYFTLLFIGLVITFGMTIAIILDKKFRGTTFFRMVFMLPMAISYVVTGVIWRWCLNPESGFNLLLGTNFRWYTNTSVYPPIKIGGISVGFPVAILSVVIATLWQLLGFSIALYLSGLTSISEDVREAARIDGANEWQINTRIIIPLLRPVTMAVFIQMFQISLKVFDLVYTMTGAGPAYVTDMPAINMYETTFRGHLYSQGAAISVCMLLAVIAIVVPAQIWGNRGEDS